MARQSTGGYLEGTFGNLTFYKMNGKYYAREKTSLTGKRVKNDPAFALFREHSNVFGKASTLASIVYHMMDKEVKHHSMYNKLTGIGKRALCEGLSAEEAMQRMIAHLVEQGLLQPVEVRKIIVDKVSTPVVVKAKEPIVAKRQRSHKKLRLHKYSLSKERQYSNRMDGSLYFDKLNIKQLGVAGCSQNKRGMR